MQKVSIILPVYNVEKYIRNCIESIINQTCKNFELIIVDDGTKDHSIEIAEDLLKKSDINYRIVHRENGGLSAARNTGIKVANGEYLCFVDSDDVINPQYVETLLSDIEANDVLMGIANFRWFTEKDIKQFDMSNTQGVIVNKKEFLYKILRRKIFNYFGCFIISRDYILRNNLWFDETVFFGVDQAYMWRLMVGVEKYTYNQKIIYNYFERPNSIMTGTKVKKMLTGLPSLEKCAEDLKDNPYFDSELIVVRWKISALHTIAKGFEFSQFKEAISLFKPNAIACLKYPDIKVRLLYFPMMLGVKAFYSVLRVL